ncbi:MAG: DUF2726 domain-containing protein [Acidobacteria bacterium]|nr:DUF2726 domain-containing protein [Acidobacteriota bacterium]
MAVESRSIFGSGAEKETFLALRSSWKDEVDVFPQMSVKAVIGFDRLQAIEDENEKNYLLQTEFDYVICWKNKGFPLLVVEFDGIGGGFSRGIRYETRVLPINDRNRHKKLEAKLRNCGQAGIPVVVVSFDEARRIDATSHLTILDGIIGEILASAIFANELKRQQFSSVHEVEDLEIELSIARNPIKKEISRLLATLASIPGKPGIGLPMSQRPLDDRKNDGMIGCHTSVSVGGDEFGASAYVRDINCRGFAAYGLAQALSWLCALQDTVRANNLARADEPSS